MAGRRFVLDLNEIPEGDVYDSPSETEADPEAADEKLTGQPEAMRVGLTPSCAADSAGQPGVDVEAEPEDKSNESTPSELPEDHRGMPPEKVQHVQTDGQSSGSVADHQKSSEVDAEVPQPRPEPVGPQRGAPPAPSLEFDLSAPSLSYRGKKVAGCNKSKEERGGSQSSGLIEALTSGDGELKNPRNELDANDILGLDITTGAAAIEPETALSRKRKEILKGLATESVDDDEIPEGDALKRQRIVILGTMEGEGDVDLPRAEKAEASVQADEKRQSASTVGDADLGKAVLSIDCPTSAINTVIGIGGSIMKALQEDSGAKISIDPSEVNGIKKIYMHGTLEQAQDARSRIANILSSVKSSNKIVEEEGRGHQKEVDAEVITEVMQIPHQYVGMIIGKGGQTIREMQERTHTSMSIQQQGIPEGLPRPLTIVGREGNVALLRKEIKQMLETAPFGYGGVRPACVEYLPCPRDKVAVVIGAGGHNIKRIQEATGARVQVEQRRPMGGCPSTVVISGTKEAVGKAFEIVQDHLSKTNTPPARGPSVLVPSAPGSAMAAPSPSSRIVGQVSPYGLSGDRSSINSYGVPGYSQPPYYGRLPSPQFAEVPASPAGAYYGAQPRALPPGWLSGTDGATGRTYYYNEFTQVSQWEAP